MARYKQIFDEATQTSTFVPIDDAARRESGVAIHGLIEPFVSPVDGSVISDRKSLREHNKRNGVVSADEFSPDYYKSKAEERAREFTNNHSHQERMARRREIYEIAQSLELKNG